MYIRKILPNILQKPLSVQIHWTFCSTCNTVHWVYSTYWFIVILRFEGFFTVYAYLMKNVRIFEFLTVCLAVYYFVLQQMFCPFLGHSVLKVWIVKMGKVNSLRNWVEPFAALFWTLDFELADTWPSPPARHHSRLWIGQIRMIFPHPDPCENPPEKYMDFSIYSQPDHTRKWKSERKKCSTVGWLSTKYEVNSE